MQLQHGVPRKSLFFFFFCFYLLLQNFSGSNTGDSFTMVVSNSFLSP